MFRPVRFITASLLAVTSALMIAPTAQATTDANTAWVATWDDSTTGAMLGKNSVQLVNLDNGTVLDRIEMPDVRPAELAYSEQTGKLWVLSQPWEYGDSSIAVVDTATRTYDAAVMTANTALTGPDNVMQYSMVGDWIGDIAVSPDGSKIFVSGIDFYNDHGAILVYNADTEELLGEIPLTGSEPEGMAVNAWTNELYVKTHNPGNGDTYLETINMGATDWHTAATHVSDRLAWGDNNCGGQSSFDFDYNSGKVFGVCWNSNGYTTWSPSTNVSTFVAIPDLYSAIGIDVSADGTRIAIGTCYHSSYVGVLAADGTVSDFVENADTSNFTSKPVKFFGSDNRMVTGAWNGFLSFFTDGSNVPTTVDLLGAVADPTDISNMYIGSIVLSHEAIPELASTGFDTAPALAAGLALAAVGAVAVRRRIRR